MDRRNFAAKILTAAVGIAASAAPMAASAQSISSPKLEKCYGVNAVGRNDCAAGTHSCAGQATMARDPASFVLLPQGDCSKLAGGSLTPGKAS